MPSTRTTPSALSASATARPPSADAAAELTVAGPCAAAAAAATLPERMRERHCRSCCRHLAGPLACAGKRMGTASATSSIGSGGGGAAAVRGIDINRYGWRNARSRDRYLSYRGG